MIARRTSSLLVLGISLLALSACTDTKSKTEVPPQLRAVVAKSVAFEPRTPSRSFVGTVRPRTESDLAFRVGGKVAERLIQVGESVKTGQPLARLDETDLRLQMEQADAEVRAATASLAQADAEERRVVTLRREGWSTASAFDRQRVAVEEAKGRLNRAERTLSLARNSLDYAVLRAGADGVMTATMIEPGQVLAQGQIAMRLATLDAREAVVAIPEAMIDRARTGKASVSLWSEPGKAYAAKLRELSPSADPATRTYQARFTIENGPADLEFGLTATVTINGTEQEQIARLPLSALFNQGQGPQLYVVDPKDGSLSLKQVQVLAYETRDVLIGAGLAAGDMVVTLGVQKLDLGQRVRLAPGSE
ncbi:MAG: efflux RND transporter periplasmic adaptor subunit [Beijerinckiaceae bacterium]